MFFIYRCLLKDYKNILHDNYISVALYNYVHSEKRINDSKTFKKIIYD